MNYEDESYVRLYTRDTASWRLLGWEGQTVLMHMLRDRFDRAGVFNCDGHSASRAVTAVTGLPADLVDRGLAAVLAEKIWVEQEGKLVWPKFVKAQTCRKADRIRQQESRKNRLESALIDESCHGSSQPSQNVTLSLAELSLAKPNKHAELKLAVCKVFEFWKSNAGHPNARLDAKREARITARLKDFTADQLIAAISNRKNDPWLMGEESGRIYDGIETLLRDTAQVERLIALTQPIRKKSGPYSNAGPSQKALDAKQANDVALKRDLEARTLKARSELESRGVALPEPGKVDIRGLLSGVGV